MAARSISRTTISFGLVSVPVSVVRATGDEKSYELHQFDAESGSRIRYRKVRESDGQEVASENIVRGAETSDGQVVLLSDAEIASVAEWNPAAQVMNVTAFVEASEIDPLSLSGQSYFLVPDNKMKGAADKPYRLLADAMRRSGRLAVTVWGLRGREHPFVLGVGEDGVIIAQQLHWASQLREAPAAPAVEVTDAEAALADQLVAALSVEHLALAESDQYAAAMTDLIVAKLAGKQYPTKALESQPEPVHDLSALLLASMKNVTPVPADALRGDPHSQRTGFVLTGGR